MHAAKERGEDQPNKTQTPFGMIVANGALHCGSGCTPGDICGEWLVFTFPAIAVGFGWHSLFSERIFTVWIVDYHFAYASGILFQYFTIAPMRGLSVAQGIWAAIKADTLSLTSWHLGMHPSSYSGSVSECAWRPTPEFWYMMQIAMLFGFATAYPVD